MDATRIRSAAEGAAKGPPAKGGPGMETAATSVAVARADRSTRLAAKAEAELEQARQETESLKAELKALQLQEELKAELEEGRDNVASLETVVSVGSVRYTTEEASLESLGSIFSVGSDADDVVTVTVHPPRYPSSATSIDREFIDRYRV